MQIVTIVTDGRGCIRLAATRAPDLFRRTVAAETGDAWLTWCGVAPPGLGSRAFVGHLQYTWRAAQVADGVFRISPDAAVRSVHRQLALLRLHRIGKASIRFVRRRLAFRRR